MTNEQPAPRDPGATDLDVLGLDRPADLTSALSVVDDLAIEAVAHLDCPSWCDECLTWELPRTCPHCNGSGCGPGTAAGAYEECEYCAGDGRDHPNSSEAGRARARALTEVTAAIDAQIQSHPEPGKHTPGDHGAVRALAQLRDLINDPTFGSGVDCPDASDLHGSVSPLTPTP